MDGKDLGRLGWCQPAGLLNRYGIATIKLDGAVGDGPPVWSQVVENASALHQRWSSVGGVVRGLRIAVSGKHRTGARPLETTLIASVIWILYPITRPNGTQTTS